MLVQEMTRTVTDQSLPVKFPSDQDASGRSLGADELEALERVIRSGVLTCTKGTFVRDFERDFAALIGSSHAIACSSGSAAVHAAVAAIDPEPGDEIISSPITDMGAISPILYQGAIPVFADVHPVSGNVTADSVARVLSDRTKAIIVTHLFGWPCPMTEILRLADGHGIPVIEDCSQAYLARHSGRCVGTLGAIGCFSLQQGKHLTAGEGGIVVSEDPQLARRMRLFVNKAWGYGDPNPDHYFLALNYRMTELQGAVLGPQLARLPEFVAHRREMVALLAEELADAPGVALPNPSAEDEHAFWRVCLRVDPAIVPGGCDQLARRLQEAGILCAPRYIRKPAFQCEIFAQQRTFGQSRFPFTLARPAAVDYSAGNFPGTFDMLERALVLGWNEKITPAHVQLIGSVVRRCLILG